MRRLEVFYDVSSPWTYLAFHNLQSLIDDLKPAVTWKPILVGGVFNSVNPSVYASREHPVPAKAAYMLKDMQDWARLAGLRIVFPPKVFPVNSVKALRGCIWAETQGKQLAFARACFELYWGDDLDISRDDVLAAAAGRAGLDFAAMSAAIGTPEIKAQLKANTDELIARGGFGSPTMYVDGGDMYFGNDRLPLIAAALSAQQ